MFPLMQTCWEKEGNSGCIKSIVSTFLTEDASLSVFEFHERFPACPCLFVCVCALAKIEDLSGDLTVQYVIFLLC